jgi:hypothetical protein
VLGLGSPSVLVIFKRLPKKLPPHPNGPDRERWTHHLRLMAHKVFPSSDTVRQIVDYIRGELAKPPLEGDSAVIADMTEAGSVDLRLVHEIGLPVTPVCAGTAPGPDGVRSVPVPELVREIRLAFQDRRFEMVEGLPGIGAELRQAMALGDFPSPTSRCVAFGMWWGRVTGHSEFVTRMPTEAEGYHQWSREAFTRAQEEREREWQERRAEFGDDTEAYIADLLDRRGNR